MSLEHTPKSVAELVTIIGAAAAAAPEIAAWVRSLTDGDRGAIELLQKTLPADAPTAAWEREYRYKQPPVRNAVASVVEKVEKVENPPEYDVPDEA